MAMDLASKPLLPHEKHELFFDQEDEYETQKRWTLRTVMLHKFRFIVTFAFLAGLFITGFKECAKPSSADLVQPPTKAIPHSLMIELDTSSDTATRTIV